MARNNPHTETESKFQAAESWKQKCLLGSGSMFSDDRLWTPENVHALEVHFVERLNVGEGSFVSKLSEQLQATKPEVKQLAAEILWLMQLCPSNINPDAKREVVKQIWSWSGLELDLSDPLLSDKVLDGIGSGGTSFNTNRWRELVYVINFLKAFYPLEEDKKTGLLAEPWEFAAWLETVPGSDSRQFRHMLVYLLFPDFFERVFSGGQRRKIIRAFHSRTRREVRDMPAIDIDKALFDIRLEQENLHPDEELDFYTSPLKEMWDDDPPVVNQAGSDFSQYQQADVVKEHFGEPDFEFWSLYQSSGLDAQKGPAVIALHLVFRVAGKTIEDARKKLNTYTLANYGVRQPLYVAQAYNLPTNSVVNRNHYCEPAIFGCYYDDNAGFPESFNETKIKKVLGSEWGSRLMDELGVSKQDVERYMVLRVSRQLMNKDDSAMKPAVKSNNKATSNLVLYGPPGTGKTYQLNQIKSEYVERYEFVTFHQSYGYEDFVEGIRPCQDEETLEIVYRVEPGVFRRICQRAKADPEYRYAIFVDEINRGNIAKILGELITLIELDKRAHYDDDGNLLHGMELTLPYSGDSFGVPANLDIYATMNTADRSIALLDTALRRRFRFRELMPDSSVIKGSRGDGYIEDGEGSVINLRALLDAINKRMKFLLHRDQAIGHAYFIDVRTFADLKEVLLNQIIPLLQEYFYEDWHRIQLVFRDVGPDNAPVYPQLICHTQLSEEEILGFDHDDYEDGNEFWVANEKDINPACIRKIYESA
jgi:5-methylcytosine-specific restriction protein B